MKSATLKKIVLIGASTGGPGQIEKIISSLPELENTSLIIAQHMVEGFLESFASRLQKNTTNSIRIIRDKTNFKTSHIYMAQGNLEINAKTLTFHKIQSSINSYNPDINTLFSSFSPLCKDFEILSVILTGIGSDGVDACINLSLNKAQCITESELSAIVDGMPSRARLLVPNIKAYDIDEITKIISEFCDV